MENEKISISVDKKILQFEIGDYLHEDGERCKFRVFQEGKLMVSFTPDQRNILHLCQNPGKLKEEVIHLLADQIEARHPYGF